MDDGRLIQLLVQDRDILDLLNWRHAEYVALPGIADVPKDAVVTAVNWDFSRRAFVLTVSHPSFEVVPHGQLIPIRPALAVIDRYLLPFDQASEAANPPGPAGSGAPAMPEPRRPWEFLGDPKISGPATT